MIASNDPEAPGIENSNPEKIFLDQIICEDSNKHFSKEDSEMIVKVVESCCLGRKTVNWAKVSRIFNLDSNHVALMKKIKYHYYNLRSKEARKKTKKSIEYMVFLGLNIDS